MPSNAELGEIFGTLAAPYLDHGIPLLTPLFGAEGAAIWLLLTPIMLFILWGRFRKGMIVFFITGFVLTAASMTPVFTPFFALASFLVGVIFFR